MEFHGQRVEARFVQHAHRQYQETDERVFSFAADLDIEVGGAQGDPVACLNDTEGRRLRHQPEVPLQSATEVEQRAAGGERVAERMQIGDMDVPGDRQAEIRIVGGRHAGAVQPGQGGRCV